MRPATACRFSCSSRISLYSASISCWAAPERQSRKTRTVHRSSASSINGIRSRNSSARLSMYPRWRAIRGCSSISRRFGAKDGPWEVVVLISHPLVDVGRVLPQILKVAVKLVGDDEALFAVEVADREAIGKIGRAHV